MSGALRQFTARQRDTGFDPLSIGWTVALYADDLALSDGAAVATWADSSGNGYDATQATSGSRPIYRASVAALNGQPAVDFDGTDDWVRTGAFASALTHPFDIVAVASGFTGSNQQIAGRYASAGGGVIVRSVGSEWGIYAGANLSGGTHDSAGHLLRALFNTTTSRIDLDGGLVTSGDSGTRTLAGLRVGTDYDGGAAFPGPVAFIAVFDGTLTAQNLSDLLAWSRDKYATP